MNNLSRSLLPTAGLLATATLLVGLSQGVTASAAMPWQGSGSGEYELEILTAIPSGSIALDLNNEEQVVGQLDTGEAFLYEQGQVTAFQIPGAVATIATSINDRGDIFGAYFTAGGGISGFSLDPEGNTMDINFPGVLGTFVFGGNNPGDTVGIYIDAMGNQQSFLRTKHGVYSTITPPGNLLFSDAIGINDNGVISGDFFDDTYHAFLLVDGVYTITDVPGAMSSSGARTNNQGDLIGTYNDFDTSAFGQGFVRTKHGVFHEVTFPDPAALTQMAGITDDGHHLVGSAFYQNGSSVSFLWHRVGHED